MLFDTMLMWLWEIGKTILSWMVLIIVISFGIGAIEKWWRLE